MKLRALECKHLHDILGHPSDHVLKAMLASGKILNTHMVVKDVEMMREICGPCAGCIQGKLPAARSDVSSNYKATSIGELVHMDLIRFGSEDFIIAVDEYSNFCSSVQLPSKKRDDVLEAVVAINNVYKSSGNVIRAVRTDSEAVLVSIQNEINGLGITCSNTIPEQHAVVVERAIRTIKDKARSLLFNLSYSLPQSLWRYAIEEAVQSTNYLLNSKNEETPNEMFYGKKYDLNFAGQHSFGTVAWFRVPYSHGNNQKRSALGVVVGHVSNSKDMHLVWNPSTKKVVRRGKGHVTPPVDEVLKIMELQDQDHELITEVMASDAI
jgi:hypothetical protein